MRRDDLADWPNAAASSFVRAGGLDWHVQRAGSGPRLLLVHGTGAATHSWRDMLPRLATRFDVLAPDLPGHGFTALPPTWKQSLPGMAHHLGALLAALDFQPAIVVGHSAGAAILARLVLDGAASPALFIALNGALRPMRGMAGQMFSGIARTLALMPVVPWFLSWRAQDRSAVVRLIENTGSAIDDRGLNLYARLMRDPVHVAGVLAMMANWDLEPLHRDLPCLRPLPVLVVGERDRALPEAVSRKVADSLPGSRLILQPGLGHLSHEEDPAGTVDLIEELAEEAGVLAREQA